MKSTALARWTARYQIPLFIFLALGISQMGQSAGEPDVTLALVGTPHPSSFPTLMWIHITNPALTPLNLMEAMGSSKLLIDGKPHARADMSFEERPGVPPAGEWEGCLSTDNYPPPLAPGKHVLQLSMSGAQSNTVTVQWSAPVDWRKGTLKTRLNEVRELASAIKKGLPRPCVEQWLTLQDGGLQETRRVRYYLEPQIKIVVPYAHSGESGNEDDIVNGSPRVYQEARIMD